MNYKMSNQRYCQHLQHYLLQGRGQPTLTGLLPEALLLWL